MNILSAIVVFVIIWLSVFFCVLPFGMSTTYEEQGQHIGPGAPSSVNMKKKFLITTAITIVLYIIAYLIITSGYINVREWALSDM
tara:strand:- start:688 stop:942 length:255 start_codon:yes stop_codon:yes gene_type:complete